VTVSVIPTLPLLTLSDAEQSLVTRLNNQRSVAVTDLQLRDAYYNGNQLIRDLGISIPPQMRGLHTVVGWPQVAVDALDERLDVQGFRFAGGGTSGDDDLQAIWQANDMDGESQLAHLDALIHRAAFTCVGSGPDGPKITIESEYAMSVLYDPWWRQITAALRVYGGDEHGRQKKATLYLPNETISLSQSIDGSVAWLVENRDRHNFGECLVARLANRQRISHREGASEISTSMMSIVDGACRTMLGLEASREFYAAAKLALLGADESQFVDAEGNKKSVWETYIGRILAIGRDENGELPDIKKLEGSDPTPFTKIMAEYRQNFATLSKLPPYMLGETTQNPASADAIRAAENGLIRKAERRQQAFSEGWETTMRLALRVANGGRLPAGAERIETDWASAATPTPAATTDAIVKQIAAGAIPPESDVALKRLGYSAEERRRIAEERAASPSEALVNAVASALEAKASRSVNVLENAAANLAAPATPPTP
jgi:hypothetical protein